MTKHYDVAIVGYGPVGQALANILLQKGHQIVVVERWQGLFPLPRAIAYDHEIGRIFQSIGVADDLAKVTCSPTAYEWRNRDGAVLLRFNWTGTGLSGWPAMTSFSQPILEGILSAKAQASPNLTLLRGYAADRVTEGADGVTLDLTRQPETTSGPEAVTISAKYVVGCDGANSLIRPSMGADYLDLDFSADWLVVDVIPNDLSRWTPDVWQHCDPARPTTVVSGGPNRRRWEFMVLPGETKEAMNRAEIAWELLKPWDYTPENAKLERHAVYTFRGAHANSWRRGRLMLAGDAAHLMPPFAAQGMCAGIRDAAALGWRLDLVLRGLAQPEILDTYGPERDQHVCSIIDFAIGLGKVICITDENAAAGRDAAMLAAVQDPSLAPPPPPPPRLGPGLLLENDPRAGYPAHQGIVTSSAGTGLFDDIVGRGFCLLSRIGDPGAALSAQNRLFWDKIGGIAADITGDGAIKDETGSFAAWFDEIKADIVLVRPDFYVFGAADTLAGADALVTALQASGYFK